MRLIYTPYYIKRILINFGFTNANAYSTSVIKTDIYKQ